MKIIGATILGATALMFATVAPVHAQSAQVPDQSQVTEAPFFPPSPWPTEPGPPSLFSIAGFNAYLWAPVEPQYDANNNRNLAADPFWTG